MKILAKLLTGFVAVALLAAVVGVVGIVQMGSLSGNIKDLSNQTIPVLENLRIIDAQLTTVKMAVRSMTNPLGLGDKTFIDRQITNINAARTAYKAARDAYEKIPMVSEEERLYKDVQALYDPAAAFNDQIIALVTQAQTATPAEAQALYQRVFTLINSDQRLTFDNLQKALIKVIDYDKQYYGVEMPRHAIQSADAAILLLLIVTVLAFVVAILLGIFLGTSISRSLNKATAVIGKIARGDLSERFTVKSRDEFKQVSEALGTMADNIQGLINEAGVLTKAAVEGRLATRGDANKFQGGYQEIVKGVNATLDAVIGPLNVTAKYVDDISKGVIPPIITDNYNGEFNIIKTNLNSVVTMMSELLAETDKLVKAAINGQLATRADATKFQGGWHQLVAGVNETLETVIAPVNETIAVLKQLAQGDMTIQVTGDYKGDFDILKTALNDSINSINEILVQVSLAVEQVTAGSQQVSQASQALSQGATEQASSLEEITSSVTEIAGQTKQNTENAVRVNGLSGEAKESAVAGDSQMKALVKAMEDINRSAEEIGKVVKAIDDISFQINLLALNANVEAARAGKYGKGFAVVAEEVRNLAVRSAGSVKETTAMVEEVKKNIGKGNNLVEATAKQLSTIVTGVSQVASLAEEVATASREQNQGLEQISTGLNQIDQVTQSNTASAEESASAAEELSSQAQQLKAMIGKFKLRAGEGHLSEEQMMAALRAEMARGRTHLGGGATGGAQAAVSPKVRSLTLHKEDGKTATPHSASAPAPHAAPGAKRLVNPADVINLDDDDFGKF